MANSYYNNTTNIIVNGTSAEAEDVENKCDDIATAFDSVEDDMDERLLLSAADYVTRELNTTLALRAGKVLGFDIAGNPAVFNNDIASAELARDAAWAWSSEAEDVLVSDGINPDGYSAYHWSEKASASAAQAAASAVAADGSAFAAAGAANGAAIAAALAAKWATESEDVVVQGGEYSAYHWAQKAEGFAQSIANPNILSNTGFKVAQRGTSSSVGVSTPTIETADRWMSEAVDQAVSANVTYDIAIGGGTTVPKYLRVQTVGTDTGFVTIGQQIEMISEYSDKNFTFTVEVYLPSGTTYDASATLVLLKRLDSKYLRDGTQMSSTLISSLAKDTWHTLTVTSAMGTPTDYIHIGVGVRNADIGVTAKDVLFIRRPKVEIGSSSTEYTEENVAEEFIKCSRFYYRTQPRVGYGVLLGNSANNGVTGHHAGSVNFPVRMRATPTMAVLTAAPAPLNCTFKDLPVGSDGFEIRVDVTGSGNKPYNYSAGIYEADAEF